MSGWQQGGGGRGGYNGGGGNGNYNSGGDRGGSFGGRGGRGARRGGGNYMGRGGGGRQGPGSGNVPGEPAVYNICKFHATSGNCTYGAKCKNDHIVTLGFCLPVHPESANTVAMLNIAGNPIPKILTGGGDPVMKIWNIGTNPPTMETGINTTGKVRHIEVVGDTVMWSVDELVAADQPDLTVGTVYLLNNADMSSIPIKKSADMPCTHPMGEIRSFKIANVAGSTYVITAGGEGLIRTWRYDPTQNKFEQVALLEGHLRAVTCVLLQDTYLWSGSTDKTIRVWDVTSSACIGTLTSSGGGPGHTAAVTCLTALPPASAGAESYIASGGMDGEVKLWKTNGEAVYHVGHECEVTAVASFTPDNGGVPLMLVGLMNGSLLGRSRNSMTLLFRIDSSFCRTSQVTSIQDMGQRSAFVLVGTEGQLLCWSLCNPVLENK